MGKFYNRVRDELSQKNILRNHVRWDQHCNVNWTD